jgi:hypothetical protein
MKWLHFFVEGIVIVVFLILMGFYLLFFGSKKAKLLFKNVIFDNNLYCD